MNKRTHLIIAFAVSIAVIVIAGRKPTPKNIVIYQSTENGNWAVITNGVLFTPWLTNEAPTSIRPGYGWNCARCGTNMYDAGQIWHTTKFHFHEDDPDEPVHRGCFVLCEPCFQSLTPAERLPYYRGLWDLWKREGDDIHTPEDWIAISNAVMEGK